LSVETDVLIQHFWLQESLEIKATQITQQRQSSTTQLFKNFSSRGRQTETAEKTEAAEAKNTQARQVGNRQLGVVLICRSEVFARHN
jgi:hypothetical protein